MDNIQKLLGKKIQSRRKKLGLTQIMLAEQASLSLKHLGEVERGRGNPTLESLRGLSGALGYSLQELFELEQETPSLQDVERSAIALLLSASPDNKIRILKILKALCE